MKLYIALCLVYTWTGYFQHVSSTTIGERLACNGTGEAPATRVNTTERLAAFRTALAAITNNGDSVVAFIVGSQDPHNSEYPTAYDKRRAYISGFSGSAGTAVITQNKAALWTDGRYHTEADEVLDCNWLLMKSGVPGVPEIAEWINSEMPSNGLVVGVDWKLVTHTYFAKLKDELVGMSRRADLRFIVSTVNPVDTIWTTDRPPLPSGRINVLPLPFAGKSWQDKVRDLRDTMTLKGVNAFVVTALDEVAWLFNLRGSDISYNPFFLGYAIVQQNAVTLYIRNMTGQLIAPPTDSQSTTLLMTHLGTSGTGTCAPSSICVELKEYDQTVVESDLSQIVASGSVWLTAETNYAIYREVMSNVVVDKSPIAIVKSMKNDVERQGMTNSHNRDSAALIKFLAFMEKEIEAGNTWTEMTAADELGRRRSELTYNRGLSFETISSYGSNGAIIHYRPSNITDKTISTDSLFLLDSGGQYLDGTTDVTRTMHYGTPTAFQKECYTRVLMSAINLATLKWPKGLYGRQIDALARYQLWDAGLVYRHGTGHGIGAYLSVHEGPGRIALISTPSPSDEPLSLYQYYSDEPGYYEPNNFGIRLETIMTIALHQPKYTSAGETFYQFNPVTLVPFETNLIDQSLMNSRQKAWLNTYNSMVRSDILPLLAGDQDAINWVNARTQPVSTVDGSTGAQCGAAALYVYPVLSLLLAVLCLKLKNL